MIRRGRLLSGTVGAGSCLVASLSLLVSGGEALAAKYKKSEVQVKAEQSHLTKIEKKAEAEAPKRPTLAAEQFRASAEAKVVTLTNAAIAKLKQLVAVTDDSDPEKPDFYFRLAEHYREKKNQYMFKARELDEEIFTSHDPVKKERLKSLQKQYEQTEQQWLVSAIKMYITIAAEAEGKYSKFKRMDEVLFNVADMLNQAKRHDKARIFFGQLIKNYPQSRYIPDAYLAFAEYYFNQGQVEGALKLYDQVGKYPDSPIYGYAVYKQGWCWLNLKDPRRALELFVKVIKNAEQWSGTKRGKIMLVKEAKKDAVRAYAHVGTPDRAWNFFKRIGGDYAMNMLERLANMYYDQGKFLDSILVYKQLIKLDSNSKSLCSWQYNIVRATLSGRDKRSQVVEVKRLAAVYGIASKRAGMKKTAIEECRGNSSGVLRELATTWHREAQKTQNDDTYGLAQYLYKEYLDSFPNEKDAYVMSFYYAELLFKIEKWEAAADAYTKVVKMRPNGAHLKEAAYAAVISWKNALNVQEEMKDTEKVKPGEAQKPRPIPPNQQKMIAAFDTYIKYVPNSPELVSIMYRKARIYYENNYFQKAADMFAIIATKHPDHELALYSANLLLDALNILKKYDELSRWVETFLKSPKLAQGEFLAQLRKLKGGLQRKIAEQMQKDARYRECGEKYAELANEYQDDARWAELVYNAALCFEAAKLIGQAIAIRSTLIQAKPKHPLAQKALYMIGANYHALAWYSRAAENYEKFATQFPGEKQAPEALQNAIVFRLGRAEYDKAIEDSKLFEKSYGSRPQYAARTAAVNFSLGMIYEQRGDVDGVVKHYKNWLGKWGRHGGVDRQVVANVKMGEALWRASCPKKGVNGACITVTRERAKRKIAKATKKKKKSIELKTQCGPETKSKIVVEKRNPGKAKSAQAYFKAALSLYKKGGKKAAKGADKEEMARRTQELEHSAAAAIFYLAEEMLEDFLAVKFPQGLDFSASNKAKLAKSNKEFTQYLGIKGKKLAATRTVYQDVIKTLSAHWAIAASARIGQLFQNFADALYTAPVPKPPVPKQLMNNKDAREEFISTFNDAYCDRLEDEAGKLEAKAVEGLDTCLKKSTELSWYNEWSTLCEAELNQIKPAEYPLAAEIRAQPGYVAGKADVATVVESVK
ncbi:MAG: tetratricopeptide repeat protein [Deltaproteobacteria bacterium]|nr:tetratricopeptide repeat protein [Deltaproteobacteria bacterium]